MPIAVFTGGEITSGFYFIAYTLLFEKYLMSLYYLNNQMGKIKIRKGEKENR